MKGARCVVISVSRGQAGPFMYRGSAYRRVGKPTVKMRADEYRRMLFERMHGERRWENQPADEWSVDDLDANEIRTTVGETVPVAVSRIPGRAIPATCFAASGYSGTGFCGVRWSPFSATKNASGFDMPQCLLRVARFDRIDRTEFLDNRQVHGNAFSLLRAAERFLRDSLPIAGRIKEGRFERIDEPLFPPPRDARGFGERHLPS